LDKQLIVRTVVLALALANQFLVMMGYSPLPFESEEIEEGITAVITVLATLWTYYKNNSFTKEAKEADRILKQKKAERKAKQNR